MFSKSALLTVLSAVLATGVVSAADAPAPPAASAATTAAITALYQLSCTAALDPTDKNLDAMFAVMSADYVEVDPKGKEMKRDEIVGQTKQQLKLYHSTECKNAIDSVTATDPNSATVNVTSHISGDAQAPDGKHEFDYTGKSQDSWKLVDGKWSQVKTKTLHIVVKVDGSVVQEQGQ